MSAIIRGAQFRAGAVRAVEDALAIEAPLQVKLNGRPFTVTMRTPGDDELLVRGLLCTEGILLPDGAAPEMAAKVHPETGTVVCLSVTVPEGSVQRSFDESRTFMSTSSCGLCGSKELPETRSLAPVPALSVDPLAVLCRAGAMMDAMRARQSAFDSAGGTHAAGLFAEDAACLAVFEDIGRHNAVDKIVGWQLLHDPQRRGRILTVSGRVSYEIVVKAWRAGIGLVAGVSAPSTLAVETGARAGIAVAGFCRDDRATLYAPHLGSAQA